MCHVKASIKLIWICHTSLHSVQSARRLGCFANISSKLNQIVFLLSLVVDQGVKDKIPIGKIMKNSRFIKSKMLHSEPTPYVQINFS